MQREIMPRREAEYRPAPEYREREGFTDLLKDLAEETRALVRQEASLARLEMKETASELAKDGVKVGIGVGLAAVGGLVLTAFLVLVIGALLDGAYWAGALIVGAVFLLVGGLVARSAIKDLQRTDVKPDQTIETLNEDKRWLKREARDFRRETMS